MFERREACIQWTQCTLDECKGFNKKILNNGESQNVFIDYETQELLSILTKGLEHTYLNLVL